MTTLPEFLTDRIADDEAAAHKPPPGVGEAATWSHLGRPLLDGSLAILGEHHAVAQARPDWAWHIARWDPARVLAECEAKRRIVEVHLSGEAWCDHCSGGEHRGNPDACPTLRLLALPYADHPDYDETWRP